MITFEEVQIRMIRKRASRRRLGWFDFCRDSWDVRSTGQRAWRIWRRLSGVREPLLSLDHEHPIPWNSYHS